MIPIFEGVQGIDENNPRQAILQLIAYIGRLERLIERYFSNIGSENLGKLNLDDLTLYTEHGSEISGDKIKIVGPDKECFEVGYDRERQKFVFNLPEGCEVSIGTLNVEKINTDTIEAKTITATGAITGYTVEGTYRVYCDGHALT